MKNNIEIYKTLADVYNVEFSEKGLEFGCVYKISEEISIDITEEGVHLAWVEIITDTSSKLKSVSELDKLIEDLNKAKKILKMLKLYGFKIAE